MSKFKFSDSAYNILKWLCLIALPAIATCYGVISSVWGLPYGKEITTTITAIATMIGAMIGISHVNYYDKEDREDGKSTESD